MKLPKQIKKWKSPGKKAFIADVIVDFWAYIVFVLVIIVFAILYTYEASARTQRLQDVKDVTYGNYLAAVYLKSPINVGTAEMTMAELIALYDYNQTFEREDNVPREVTENSDVAIFFGFQDELNPLGDAVLSITDEFVADNYDEDKCYVFAIQGNGFDYSRRGPACISVSTTFGSPIFISPQVEDLLSYMPSIPDITFKTYVSPVDPREDPIVIISIFDMERLLDIYNSEFISNYDFEEMRREAFGDLAGN